MSERRKLPPDQELARVSALSDEQLDDELRAAGIDPEHAGDIAKEVIDKAAREAGLDPSALRAGGAGSSAARAKRRRVGGPAAGTCRWWAAPIIALAAALGVWVLLLWRRQPQRVEAASLPDAIPGFAAGPLDSELRFSRRSYTRGDATTVVVTIGRLDLDASGYEQWGRNGQQGYRQARLNVGPGLGNGYYDCADETAPGCDLQIQLRSGVHIEIRGNSAATQADLDAVAAGLPLQVFAHGTP